MLILDSVKKRRGCRVCRDIEAMRFAPSGALRKDTSRVAGKKHLAHWLRILVVVAAVIAVLTITSCSDQTAIYTVETRITQQGKVIRQPILKTVAHVRQEAAASGPRAAVDRLVHDFGQIDPLTVGNHVFVIRNAGDAPLQLEKGPTTCKCTLSSLNQHELQPGETARVVLTWNSGREPIYLHRATVFTSDPRNKAIQLTVKGRVRALFQCAPAELTFSRVGPDETPSATTIIYSQAWNSMEIDPIRPTVKGLTCDVQPASADQLESLDAESGYQLTITVPKAIEAGFFNFPVRIHGTSDRETSGAAESADTELMISGKKLQRLGIYGPAIDLTGTVRLGRVQQGQGVHARLLVKVRDSDPRIALKSTRSTPDFLKVRLEPYKKEQGEKIGLYYLYLDVPRDSPTFRLPPGQHGSIQLELEHPRIHQLELPVDLIISSQ